MRQTIGQEGPLLPGGLVVVVEKDRKVVGYGTPRAELRDDEIEVDLVVSEPEAEVELDLLEDTGPPEVLELERLGKGPASSDGGWPGLSASKLAPCRVDALAESAHSSRPNNRSVRRTRPFHTHPDPT